MNRQQGAWTPQQLRSTAPLEAGFAILSPREREILALYPGHGRYKSMALAMGIAHQTFRNHVSSILAKLGLASLGQAAVLYDRWERGLGWPDVDQRHGERRRRDRRER